MSEPDAAHKLEDEIKKTAQFRAALVREKEQGEKLRTRLREVLDELKTANAKIQTLETSGAGAGAATGGVAGGAAGPTAPGESLAEKLEAEEKKAQAFRAALVKEKDLGEKLRKRLKEVLAEQKDTNAKLALLQGGTPVPTGGDSISDMLVKERVLTKKLQARLREVLQQLKDIQATADSGGNAAVEAIKKKAEDEEKKAQAFRTALVREKEVGEKIRVRVKELVQERDRLAAEKDVQARAVQAAREEQRDNSLLNDAEELETPANAALRAGISQRELDALHDVFDAMRSECAITPSMPRRRPLLAESLSNEPFMRAVRACVRLFKKGSTDFATALASRVKMTIFDPGEHIIDEGQVGKEMYFIARGTVTVSKAGTFLAKKTMMNFFGEVASLSGSTVRTATVIADEDVDIFTLHKEDLLEVLKKFPRESRAVKNVVGLYQARDRERHAKAMDSIQDFFMRFDEGIESAKVKVGSNKTLYEAVIVDVDAAFRKREMFRDASPEFISELVFHFVPAQLDSGEFAMHIGEEAKDMFYLMNGALEILDANERKIGDVEDGSLFGVTGVITESGKRSASVRAVTLCNILTLSKTDLYTVLDKFPAQRVAMTSMTQAQQALKTAQLGMPSSAQDEFERIMESTLKDKNMQIFRLGERIKGLQEQLDAANKFATATKTESLLEKRQRMLERKQRGGPAAKGAPQTTPLHHRITSIAGFNEEVAQVKARLVAKSKWHMVTAKHVMAAFGVQLKPRTITDPSSCITMLSEHPALKTLLSLTAFLRNRAPLSWIEEFVKEDGLSALENLSLEYEQLVREGVGAALINMAKQIAILFARMLILQHVEVFEYVIAEEKLLHRLFMSALQSNNTRMQTQVFGFAAEVVRYSPDGHREILDALRDTVAQTADHPVEVRKKAFASIPGLFNPLADILESKEDSLLRRSALALINALLATTESLDERVALRDNLLKLGFNEVVRSIAVEIDSSPFPDDKLRQQIASFDSALKADMEEVETVRASLPVDLTDRRAVLQSLVTKVEGTNQEHALDNIFQHLLLIAGDAKKASWSFRFLETAANHALVGDVVDTSHGSPKLRLSDLSRIMKQALQSAEISVVDQSFASVPGSPPQAGRGQSPAPPSGPERNALEQKIDTLNHEVELAKTDKARVEQSVVELQAAVTDLKRQLAAAAAAIPAPSGPPPPVPPPPTPPPPLPPLPQTPSGAPPPVPPVPKAPGPPAVPPPPPPGKGVPPPPPPGGKGGPPPPPGGGTPEVPEVAPLPTVPMKGFFWAKIGARAAKNTWWEKWSKAQPATVEIERAALEQLFCAKKGKAAGEDKAAELEPTKKKEKYIALLNSKRANNVAITLKMFKAYTYDDVALLVADAAALMKTDFTADHIATLLRYAPEDDELETVMNFEPKEDERDIPLRDAEEFFRTVGGVPQYKGKLEALYTRMTFDEKIAELEHDLDVLHAAATELTTAPQMEVILETVRAIGNFLNAGTPRGRATGFKLATLLKLEDSKATTDPRVTLMTYLADVLARKDAKLLDWHAYLPNVLEAAKREMSLKQLEADAVKLKAAVRALEQTVEASKGEANKFYERMSVFTTRATTEVDKMVAKLEVVNKAASLAIVTAADDPGSLSIEEAVKMVGSARDAGFFPTLVVSNSRGLGARDTAVAYAGS